MMKYLSRINSAIEHLKGESLNEQTLWAMNKLLEIEEHLTKSKIYNDEHCDIESSNTLHEKYIKDELMGAAEYINHWKETGKTLFHDLALTELKHAEMLIADWGVEPSHEDHARQIRDYKRWHERLKESMK